MHRNWIAKFKNVCGLDLTLEDFLPIAETARLKEAFFLRIKEGRFDTRTFYPRSSLCEIKGFFKEIQKGHSKMRVVLFSNVDKNTGAVQIPLDIALEKFEEIWGLVGEDFCLVSPEFQDGLCLEVNFYDGDGEYVTAGVFELSSWGIFKAH